MSTFLASCERGSVCSNFPLGKYTSFFVLEIYISLKIANYSFIYQIIFIIFNYVHVMELCAYYVLHNGYVCILHVILWSSVKRVLRGPPPESITAPNDTIPYNIMELSYNSIINENDYNNQSFIQDLRLKRVLIRYLGSDYYILHQV